MADKGVLLAEIRTLSESSGDDDGFPLEQPNIQKSMSKRRRQVDESQEPSNSEVFQLLLQQNQTLMKIIEKMVRLLFYFLWKRKAANIEV